jgi:hypothetical protein
MASRAGLARRAQRYKLNIYSVSPSLRAFGPAFFTSASPLSHTGNKKII